MPVEDEGGPNKAGVALTLSFSSDSRDGCSSAFGQGWRLAWAAASEAFACHMTRLTPEASLCVIIWDKFFKFF
jgi:hypothetical protein